MKLDVCPSVFVECFSPHFQLVLWWNLGQVPLICFLYKHLHRIPVTSWILISVEVAVRCGLNDFCCFLTLQNSSFTIATISETVSCTANDHPQSIFLGFSAQKSLSHALLHFHKDRFVSIKIVLNENCFFLPTLMQRLWEGAHVLRGSERVDPDVFRPRFLC